MTENKTSISHSKIFDYWKDKCINKDGYVLIEPDESDDVFDWENTEAVIDDLGEPTCWACGKIIEAENNPKYTEWLENKDFSKIWNCQEVRSRLQKAHIKPKALGGTFAPDNMFLLCESCHKESPDVGSDKRMFLKWVYKRKRQGLKGVCLFHEAIKILKEEYGIRVPQIDKDALNMENINTHGGAISDSTIIYGYVANALKNRTELEPEEEKMFRKYLYTKITELNENGNKELVKIYEEILNLYETLKCSEKIPEKI